MTTTTPEPETNPDVLVVDPSPAHVRSYSFDAGDERSFDRDEAISIARHRVVERGCRQQVRRVRTFDGKVALTPPWLIQDI